MIATSFRAAAAGAILALALGQFDMAVSAPAPASAEQARIDAAVQAYAQKAQTDQEAARDRLIAGHANDLLRDSRTPVIGNPDGDVAVIEFFDYACPFCKAVEPRVQQLLKSDKNVKLVVKEFPILTPESLTAARVSLAAMKQGKYEEFHQALMGFRGRLQESVIFDTAESVGLDIERLKKDMQAPEIGDAIIANFNLARALRIFETPAFIIDGHLRTEPSAEIDFPKLVAAARAK